MTRMLFTRTIMTVALVVAGLALTLVPAAGRAQDVYASISTTHFDIKYQRGVSEADVRKVATYLQEDYRYLSEKLGLDMPKKLEVRIYDSKGKFKYEASNMADWRDVLYAKNILHIGPIRDIVSKKNFQRNLSYEFVLAFLDPLGDKGCPRWLREALAVYQSGEAASLTPPMGGRLVSFGDLEQDIQEYPNPPQRDDVHYILDQTMKFFLEKYGEKKTFSMFKEFQTTFTIESVFKKRLGDDFQTVEKAWAAYVAAHSASMKY